jgi:hypothetical protein
MLILEAVAMAGGQYLPMADLVLVLEAVAMSRGGYLLMSVCVGCVVVVWLRQ